VLGVAVGEQVPSNVRPIASASVNKLSEAATGPNIDHTYGEFQVGFDVLWEVDFWGKFRRGVNSAEAAYLATVADYDDAIVSLTAEVARTYVVIRTYEVLIEQARQNVAVQEEGQQIADSRFRNGATSELDVVQATNLLETTRASIPKLEIGLRKAENALSTLLGQPSGHLRSLLGAQTGIPRPPAQVAVSVPAELLRRRPDIRGAELLAAAQCERIGMAKADLYPSFVLQGAIATSTTVGTATAAPLFGLDTLAGSTGASIFWPILNYPRILENVRVEDARFQQSIVVYVNTVLVAAQEVEDGIVGYLKQRDAVEFEQKAVTAAEAAVDLAVVQYREGAVDYQRVLDTQRVLLSSQQSFAQTQSDALTELVSLYKALGGGWETRLEDPVVDKRTQDEMQDRTNWGSHFDEAEDERPEGSLAPDPLQDAARK
jgi:NodT family efflux transporter outer membrane factor (OMF) lipoprotein